MADRVMQIDWIRQTARDIVDNASLPDAGASAKALVAWWLLNAEELPDWFDDHDRRLLVDYVDMLSGRR